MNYISVHILPFWNAVDLVWAFAISRSLPKPQGLQKQVDIFLAKYLLLQRFRRERQQAVIAAATIDFARNNNYNVSVSETQKLIMMMA